MMVIICRIDRRFSLLCSIVFGASNAHGLVDIGYKMHDF